MSFTSQIIRVGDGWEPTREVQDIYDVYNIENGESTALGAEGSSDDAGSLFPDTFVDMAKKANEELDFEDDQGFYKKKKKKQQEDSSDN